MNIIIVGCGKVGCTLAEQLCNEEHQVVEKKIIENVVGMLQDFLKKNDIMDPVSGYYPKPVLRRQIY